MKAPTPRLAGSHRIQAPTKRAVAEKPSTKRAVKRTAANLGLHLLSIREEVHQRIASDLHDSTCQHLIAASLNVMRMRRSINDVHSAERICNDIDASIDQALSEIRAFTYLLHPQNLLADGLKATIEHFADGYSSRTSLQTSLEITPEVDRLPYEAQRSLLRVIQEALMNVFRHAKATVVRISIEAMGTHLELRVIDDGSGMPVGSGSKALSSGVGIPGMRARLQQLGGALEIHSSSEMECRGTTLSATIPHRSRARRTRPPERSHGDLRWSENNTKRH